MMYTDEAIRKKYSRLIGQARLAEETVHQFLVRHPAFLPVYWPYDNVVFSKLPLGNQYVVDFAFARENSGGVTWHLIEIERPGDALFTRAGDHAARMVHGLGQLSNWRIWFAENRDYVRRHLPFASRATKLGLTDPQLSLIIGRRRRVSDRDRQRYADFARQGFNVMTFDRLAVEFGCPAINRSLPLRTVRFVNGDIKNSTAVAEMSIKVKWNVKAKKP